MDSINSLVVGETSQLAHYFPDSYDRLSSRNFNIKNIKSFYDRIYLTFAEQRTFIGADEKFFIDINVDYTIKIIDSLKDKCNKLIIYSTSELWNNIDGCVSIDLNYNYNYTPYIKSKEILCNLINSNRDKYGNVIIIYPFNFNSPHRKEGFLFSKIFRSILNKENISVGNIDINRDIVHPKIVINESINALNDTVVGSGELINIRNFIIDLYYCFDLNYNDYLLIDETITLKNIRKEYFSCKEYSSYDELLDLTKKDLYEYKISKGYY